MTDACAVCDETEDLIKIKGKVPVGLGMYAEVDAHICHECLGPRKDALSIKEADSGTLANSDS